MNTEINIMTHIAIEEIENLKTPFYYYDMRVLKEILTTAKEAANKRNYHIHYAIKANNNPKIISTIQELGFGADCVSGLEIKKALKYNFKANEICFAGVGKTDAEIEYAISNNIFCFNVESKEEMEVIGSIADKMDSPTRVALRINPNIDAATHHYITTGLEENKFGIASWKIDEVLEIIKNHKNLSIIGLHFHIGSQIMNLNIYKQLCYKVNEWNHRFLDKGYDLPILNVGGGLGINYKEPDREAIPDFEAFFRVFEENLLPRENQEIHFELGRALVGNCGSLISRVLYIKEGKTTDVAILDAGMTELLRPALYQASHRIDKIDSKISKELHTYDVVGPICESSDYFGKAVQLPKLNRGDFIAIRSAGAYGEVMASRYNLRKQFGHYYKN